MVLSFPPGNGGERDLQASCSRSHHEPSGGWAFDRHRPRRHHRSTSLDDCGRRRHRPDDLHAPTALPVVRFQRSIWQRAYYDQMYRDARGEVWILAIVAGGADAR